MADVDGQDIELGGQPLATSRLRPPARRRSDHLLAEQRLPVGSGMVSAESGAFLTRASRCEAP
ncbi:hypothetical protein ABZ281_02400 [Streptomyces sp. NPDC006265]|uniref:hypothetical protein n=1 Tax=Streptomyces sp. NPDC006265 TaxID=3156740 RepID=UPI0033AA592B